MTPSRHLDFLTSVAARKRILAVTAVAAVVGAAYGLLAPRWYRTVLAVVPAKQQRGGLSSLLGGDLGSLAAGMDVGGSTADAQRIAAVLQSVAVTDAVIDRFGLMERYDQRYREKARDEVWKHCEVKVLPKPNLVQLSCEDKDPRVVQQMLEHFATVGNEVFQRVSSGSAAEEVRVMERRVAELRTQADEAAAQMRDFQVRHRIVDLDSQARAFVGAMAQLEAQRIAKQMELGWVRRFSSADEPAARQLGAQLSVVEEQLRDLETPSEELPGPAARSASGGRAGKGPFPAALEVPALRAEYEKLLRNRKVVEATLVFALDRLESARASKARDVSTFQILDPPTVPTRKSRPRGSETTLAGAFIGLLAGVLGEWWLARRRQGPPPAAP